MKHTAAPWERFYGAIALRSIAAIVKERDPQYFKSALVIVESTLQLYAAATKGEWHAAH